MTSLRRTHLLSSGDSLPRLPDSRSPGLLSTLADGGASVDTRALLVHADEVSLGAAGRRRYRWPRLQLSRRHFDPLRPDELRVAPLRVGICGTDLHVLETSSNGDTRCSSPLLLPDAGRVLGHEGVAVVLACGSSDLPCKKGDIVCLESIVACQHCRECRLGRFNQCKRAELVGLERDGLFAEVAQVPARIAHVVNDLARHEEDLDALACVEPAAVALLACRNGEIAPGERVAILGGGPIGFFAAMFARTLFGAASVYVAETSPFRRDFARSVADVTGSTENLLAADTPLDVLIDAAGALEDIDRLIPRVRGRGRIVLLSRTGEAFRISHMDHVISQSLRIVGSRGHLGGVFDGVLDLMRHDRIDTHRAITRKVYGLDALADALRDPKRIVQGDCKVIADLMRDR